MKYKARAIAEAAAAEVAIISELYETNSAGRRFIDFFRCFLFPEKSLPISEQIVLQRADKMSTSRPMSQISENGADGGMGGEAGAQYLKLRNTVVSKYFDGSIAVDDFMARVEMELWRNGFTGDNSIGTSYAFAAFAHITQMRRCASSARPPVRAQSVNAAAIAN